MIPIQAVTVCVGYSDFLAAAIPYNLPHLDRWLIVTSPHDEATQKLCRDYRLQCLVSNDHRRDGPFAKGRLIERGLQLLGSDTWVLHLDADIVLRGSFQADLRRAHLDPTTVYGCDRINVPNYDRWLALQQSGWLTGRSSSFPYAASFPSGYPVGARWVGVDGYAPIGFFQLWHRLGGTEEQYGCRIKPYPSDHGTACRTDTQHALQWDRRQRALLPEVIVAHLESEPCRMGANWSGRSTRLFGAAGTGGSPVRASEAAYADAVGPGQLSKSDRNGIVTLPEGYRITQSPAQV